MRSHHPSALFRIFMLLCLWLGFGSDPAAAQARETVIHAGRLIIEPGRPPRDGVTLVIRDGRIAAIVEGFSVPEKPDAGDTRTVLDLRDYTLLPGLIDSHVHLTIEPGDPFWSYATTSEAAYTYRAIRNAEVTLAAGFTTVRDLYAPPNVMQAVRDGIAAGRVRGPRVIVAGPALSIVGGHGDNIGFTPDVGAVIAGHWNNLCTGPVACAARVRAFARDRVDLIKITATGGILSEQERGLDQHFTDEELTAIVATAHSLGLKVAAHAHGAGGVAASVRAGVDSIEHGTFATTAEFSAMRAKGTFLVPTLSVFPGLRASLDGEKLSPGVARKAEKILAENPMGFLRRARDAGVRIAFGTDAGVYPHGQNANEFQLMVTAGGMTPTEALRSATVDAAALLGLSSEVGTLAVGKAADIVAVRGDPLEDIALLRNIPVVVKGGLLVKDAR